MVLIQVPYKGARGADRSLHPLRMSVFLEVGFDFLKTLGEFVCDPDVVVSPATNIFKSRVVVVVVATAPIATIGAKQGERVDGVLAFAVCWYLDIFFLVKI